MTNYSYDPASRLTSLSQDFAGTTHDVTSSFTYTAASQIASRTRNNDLYAWNGAVAVNRPYTNNGLNQHTTSGGAALGYDGNANLTSAGGTTYGYSAENRLASYSDPAVGSRLMLYDPLGRLGLLHDGGFTYFQYDGDVAVREISTTALLRRHVHGPGSDEPLVTYEGAGLTDKRYLHADERGSIIAISNASGQVTQINAYDDYGIPQGKTPAGAVYAGGTATANFGRYGYTGQAWLPEIGLSYYKARMYSPTLGRFMQTDPIGYGDGVNLYAYVGGDPINFSDPLGLNSTEVRNARKRVEPLDTKGICDGCTHTVTAERIKRVEFRGGDPFGGNGNGGEKGSGNPDNCAIKDASGQCVFTRDKDGKLQTPPARQKKICENFDKFMKSNSQVGAAATAVSIPGVANAGTGGSVKILSRLTKALGGPFITFTAGVTGAVTAIFGLVSPPPGCN